MKKDLFIKTLLNEKARQEREERREQEQREQQARQVEQVKKALKKVYTKKIACYNVYDLKDNELLCNQFNNLDDLTSYILKYMRGITNKRNVAINYISQNKLVLDRYKIVVDKFEMNDNDKESNFQDDIKNGILYDNKSYNYDVDNINDLQESITRKVKILKAS